MIEGKTLANIQADLLFQLPVIKYSHLEVTLNVAFFSDIRRENRKIPRGWDSIWLIDFMICKQFMSWKEIFFCHFLLLFDVVIHTSQIMRGGRSMETIELSITPFKHFIQNFPFTSFCVNLQNAFFPIRHRFYFSFHFSPSQKCFEPVILQHCES